MRTPSPLRPMAAAVLALGIAIAPSAATAQQVLVFAAASLSSALDRIGTVWADQTGGEAVMSYAGSPALAKQIQQGAPADIFISASTDWMDAIEASGDLRTASRRNLLGNRLVLIAHGRGADPLPIDASLDLPGLLGDGRLAMAMVDAVPAGVYGKAALGRLGLWEAVAPQVAQAENVRAALAFVERGEAPLGIVYATDAAVSDDVSIVGIFPADSHPEILYPAALTAASTSDEAEAFLAFLSSEAARSIWEDFGFIVPD